MYYQPRQRDEALELKAGLGSDIDALAGGTDLIVALNRGQWHPANILDLSRLADGDAIREDNGAYQLGPITTHAQLTRLPIPALAEAALSIGGPQIRNRGTLAGNLGTASPAGDGCVALLALDATIELAHAERGTRIVRVRDFFHDYRRTELEPDELITGITVPRNGRSAWYKIGKRGSVNISVVCAAVARSAEGRFGLAFGSVGPYPLVTPEAEQRLNDHVAGGDVLSDPLIDEVAELVQREVSPISDHRASANYRRAMCGTLVRRLLREHFMNEGD